MIIDISALSAINVANVTCSRLPSQSQLPCAFEKSTSLKIILGKAPSRTLDRYIFLTLL